MGVEGCAKFMKYVLIIFNFLVLIAGGIAIGLGAWGLASEYGGEKIRDLTNSEIYRGTCIAIIVGGCIIVSLAFLGCCGAWMENRVMLGIYFVIMLLLLILFVVAAALGFAFKDDIKDKLAEQMKETLTTRYGVDVTNNEKNQAVTGVWDEVQKNLHCCGVKGGVKSTESWYLWQSSQWFKMQLGIDIKYVPSSCCVPGSINDACQKLSTNRSMPIQGNFTFSYVTTSNPALYDEGCIDALEDKIYDNIIAIAGIAIAVLIVMLLSIIFSVCVCVEIGRYSKDF